MVDARRMLSDRVLFIDAEAIVVDKPAGLPVDAPRDGSLSVANHLETLAFGFQRWPQPVHRLDRDTSGCLLLSRNPKAHARFQQAFETRQVEKVYWAVLDGIPSEEAGMVDAALAKVSTREDGWRMVADPRGKAARTGWRVLMVQNGRALVEMRPETGRTHQLRVHAADGIGVPIAGDPVYGKAIAARGPGMLLHARRLCVARGEKAAIDVTAPPPPSFATAGFDGL